MTKIEDELHYKLNLAREYLISISNIQNNLQGGDWDEIENARDLANIALDLTKLGLNESDLKTDANRYRWLRHHFRVFGLDIGGNHAWTQGSRVCYMRGPTLDDAIDREIAKDKS